MRGDGKCVSSGVVVIVSCPTQTGVFGGAIDTALWRNANEILREGRLSRDIVR